MKKICLMSGAVINSGDFLIEKRSLALIKHFIPDSEVTILNRVTEDYSNRIDALNTYDAIIFSGGPLYQPGLYRKGIPFVTEERISEVRTPIFFVGGGIHQNYYTCSYSPTDILFYNQGNNGENSMGCRDVFTVKFLRHVGYPAFLTGCPAWYDLDFVEKTELASKNPDVISRICVSEPGDSRNVQVLLGLLKHLRKRYPDASIKLVIHRDTLKEMMDSLPVLKKQLDIDSVNISGSAEGFSVYNDCDLHVGFRVHAHIYNLSRRNLSILFNEDIRGVGVNTTLGLDNINVESVPYGQRKLFGQYYLIKYHTGFNMHDAAGWMFDDYMDATLSKSFENYNNAFKQMHSYFDNMRALFELIKTTI